MFNVRFNYIDTLYRCESTWFSRFFSQPVLQAIHIQFEQAKLRAFAKTSNYRGLWFTGRFAWCETFNTRAEALNSKANFSCCHVIVALIVLMASEIEWWERAVSGRRLPFSSFLIKEAKCSSEIYAVGFIIGLWKKIQGSSLSFRITLNYRRFVESS